jgi:hypothetical protein
VRSASLAFAVLTSLLVAAPAVAGEPEDLLQRARQATGGDAWAGLLALYTRAEVATGGLAGRAESWADVATGRYLDRFVLGPYAGAAGFDGERAWSQEGSGRPSYREDAEALQETANESFRRSFAQWFPERHAATIESGGERVEGERRFGIVRLLPAGGRPYELWIDLATGLPDRTIEKTARETRTTLFSDFRPVGGLRLPFAQRVTNGEPKYDSRHRRTVRARSNPRRRRVRAAGAGRRRLRLRRRSHRDDGAVRILESPHLREGTYQRPRPVPLPLRYRRRQRRDHRGGRGARPGAGGGVRGPGRR